MAFSEEEFIEENITVGYKKFSGLSKSLSFGSQIHVSSKYVKNIAQFKNYHRTTLFLKHYV